MVKTTLKTRLLSVLMLIAIISSFVTLPAHALGTLPSVGETVNGFKVTDRTDFELLNSKIVVFEHIKTGADVVFCANTDTNRAFNIAFKTPVYNDKGTTHIFEHSTLSGSENYPSSTLSLKLMSQTYNTFMNAATGQHVTIYPVASLSEEQLYALSDYYLDSVFNPLIHTDSSVFEREAWHYELENANADLTISGTVYNEMKGSESINSESYSNLLKTMYPDSCVSYTSGGDPDKIPELTNKELSDYHKKYYTPSNSLTMLYGDLDFANFLALLDKYFSEFERTDAGVDFEAYTPTEQNLEATFEYPAASGSKTDKQSVIIYALECEGVDNLDLTRLNLASSMIAGSLEERAETELPGSIVSCSIDANAPETLIVFAAQNVNPSDADTFKKIVDKSIKEMSYFNFDNIKDMLRSSFELSKLTAFETSNIGASMSQSVMSAWARTDNPCTYFENTDALMDIQPLFKDDAIRKAIKKYMLAPNRTATVITVPKPGLQDEKEAAFKADLAAKKAAMSEDEINAIVAKTKEYKLNASKTNDEIDKPLIEKLSVVDAKSLPEELKEYKVVEKNVSGARLIIAYADIREVGRGRIMLDASDITADELGWFSLYASLLGNLDTENYPVGAISNFMNITTDCDVDIITVSDDNANGFTPYLIFKYGGFAEDSSLIFKVAEQVLFHTDFSDVDKLKNLVSQYANSFEKSIENYGYEYLMLDNIASTDIEQAYFEKLSGLSYLEFLKEAEAMLETDPDKVIAQLNNIKKKIANRTGMTIVYAGNEKSIKIHNSAAEAFPRTLSYNKKEPADYTQLKTEYKNKALLTNSDVNYNGIYAPFDKLGVKYNVKTDVILNYITDKFLIPELRNKHNAYSANNLADNSGITLISYRDPEVTTTFNTYANLANMLKYSDITQQDVDKYILSIYSEYVMPEGELHDAYWAAADFSEGITHADRLRTLSEIKNTTVEDVNAYVDVFEKLWDNGIIFTAGNISDIAENTYLYDEIINPMDYDMPVVEENHDEITVKLNGLKINSDVPAQIVDGRTLVPLRAIFESLNMNVEWDDATQTVTATGNGVTIRMTIGESTFTKNDQVITLDVPAQVINDRTLVPVRAISESLDYTVTWDEETQTVEITK